MKKKIILIAVILAVLLVSIPILTDDGGKDGKAGTNTDNTGTNTDNTGTIDDPLMLISEVRDKLQSDIKYAREHYKSLKMDTIEPYMTDRDEIKIIKDHLGLTYKGITDPAEMVAEYRKIITGLFGDVFTEETMNDNTIMTCTNATRTFEGKSVRLTYNEMMTLIESGGWKEDYPPNLFYEVRRPDEYQLCQLDPWMSMAMIGKGKCWEEAESQYSIVPEWNLETVAFYNLQDSSCNLEDEYQLLDRKMSVREAVEFVEQWLKEDIPYEVKPYYNLAVETVTVKKLNEKSMAYCFQLAREYEGTALPWIHNGNKMNESGYLLDIIGAAMAVSDDVDFIMGDQRNSDVECIGTIDRILPLDYALSKIANKIGENSVYTIQHIQLIYRLDEGPEIEYHEGIPFEDAEGRKHIAEVGYEYHTGKPYWLVIGENDKDNSLNYFYVDAQTGELSIESTS